MTPAQIIFVCLINTIQPPLPVAYPAITRDSHFLSMNYRYASFNLVTKVITFRDGWVDDETMDDFDRKSTATEFARYVWNKKFPHGNQANHKLTTGFDRENEKIEAYANKCKG